MQILITHFFDSSTEPVGTHCMLLITISLQSADVDKIAMKLYIPEKNNCLKKAAKSRPYTGITRPICSIVAHP
jgi:hypothetical protein